MARYIDAETLIEALQADFDREGAKAYDMAMSGLVDASVKYSHGQFCVLNAMEQVKITPTADVVPKSEVEKLEKEVAILNEKNAGLALACMCDCMANDDCLGHNEWKAIKAEVAREIFEEIARKVYSKIPDKILPVTFGGMSRRLDYNDGLNFGSRNAYFDTLKIIAELKKKYTEGKDDNKANTEI